MARHVPDTDDAPSVVVAADATAELAEVRRLLRDDRSQAAIVITERVAAAASDPQLRTYALVMRIACLINLDRGAELPAALDQAAAALRTHPDSHLTATFHAFAAMAAQVEGSLQRSVTHLARAARALADIPAPDAAGAWENLAVTYSHCGFHAHAIGALRHARGTTGRTAHRPLVPLRFAVSLDHSGDEDGARRVLREMLADYAGHRAEAHTDELPGFDRLLYGYGVVRLAVLGERVAVDPHPLLSSGGRDPASHRLRTLAAACRAIADDRPAEALRHLAISDAGSPSQFGHLLGRPEPVRLRALALARSGDAAAALEESRHAFRLATRSDERLRDLFVDGVAARLDHEDLRHTVARFAGVPVTDPLTGLLDREQVERYVATLTGDEEQHTAVIGVADLDGFKAVNTIHGHLTGDLVLQRVAGLLARAVRRGDFIARYGGDEFLVVLPDTTLTAAHDIGNRITTTINNEDWQALVPGTPITISIGWAPLDHHTNLTTAFQAAAKLAKS